MTKPVRSLVSLLVLFLFGCGGNKTPAPSPTHLAVLNGSFSFTGTSQAFKAKTIFIGGPLQSDSDGNVAGTLGITTNPGVTGCFPEGSKAIFNGTLSDQGLLTLTSQPVAGQVLTLNATVSSDGKFFSNATYAVMGGCLGGDQGAMSVLHLLAGTYTGTFAAGGTVINMTANFDRPGVLFPDTFGDFVFNASATFSNAAACGGFSSATTPVPPGGSGGVAQSGLDVSFVLETNVPGTYLSFFGSNVDSSGTTFSGRVFIQGGPCDGAAHSVTLNFKNP